MISRLPFARFVFGLLMTLTTQGLLAQDTTTVSCGGDPVDGTYCYINDDAHTWHWQSSGGEPLIMIFSAGSIESASWDHLRIYDGPDNSSTLLFDHIGAAEDLAGLQVVAASGEIYMENSSDGSVSCQSGSQTEWVWQVGCLDCTPATATYSVVTDCDNFQFSVEVNITDLGSDGTLDISADNLGTVLATATAAGLYTVGPFTANIPVTITLTNSDNSLCNVHSTPLVNPLCPTPVLCGGPPLDETYCYINNDAHTWHWQSSGGQPLIMIFSAGSIESATFDHLRIYDGPDNSSTLLFDHIGAAEDLAGLQVVAASGEIYMENSSDGSVSCQSGSQTEWVWQVGCLDCTPASATYTVITDCDNFQFTVEVNITGLGSDGTLDISADPLGTVLATATAAGVYTVGPFTANIPVTITLMNSDNSLCNVHSAPLVNPLCPQIIQCGDPAITDTYCYSINDVHAWHWQASTPGESLSLRFNAGSIQATFGVNSGDHLRIYDGPDNTSALLFDHTATVLFDLTDLQVTSSGPDIYMEMTSDGFGSCSSGATTQWDWIVGCADCTAPVATYTVLSDCDNSQFSVVVDITTMGSNPNINITNNGGALPIVASAIGTYTVGPFTFGVPVSITLSDDANTLCSIHSAPLVNPLCPTFIDCGGSTLNETYCYINNDDHEWHWQSSGGQPLALQFSAGTIESATFDHLTIYDGPDANSDTLYNHVGAAEDLTGLLFISTGADIYMTNSSDGSVSCASGSQTEWAWEIGCLDCTNPGVTFNVVEDCIHYSYSIEVNVDSTGSGSFVRLANSLSTDTLTNIMAGVTTVGPFPMDSTVTLTVMNETNNLCRVFFTPQNTPTSADCVTPVCAAQAYEYCYTNNDTAWFAYQGTENVPITIEFLWGQLMADDYVQIYNGLTASPDSLLWQGNLNGDMTGFAQNSTSGSHALLMRVISNGLASCATGQASPPLHWVVQCGAVGIHETPLSDFSMYPNPTTGELTIQLPMIARGTADMRIVDIAGRIVYQKNFNSVGGSNNFDLKMLQSGNYTVTITTNDWVKAQQLQIVH